MSDDLAAPDSLAARLTRPRFPRSATYDPQWLVDNWMGPQPLWLLEWLWPALDLRPGARVLDLGCGTALTSIFLAREYGARVTAAELWVDPAENWRRIQAAGCADTVTPVKAEAHDLPFAEGYFDAIVSIDAYHYFGTDERYLAYLSRFLAPGGRIGVVVPGLIEEIDEVPEHLEPYWQPDFWTFHSAQWWRRLWTPQRGDPGRPGRPAGRRLARMGPLERSLPRIQHQRLRPGHRPRRRRNGPPRRRPQPRLRPPDRNVNP